jgi:crotonobetainyl-CoA:carnitine CoA-transferase CaiB-like acyl-CoA transferase
MTYLTSFPGEPPLGLGTAYADHIAGLFGCLSLLGALEYRQNTGEGQHIDLSQVEAMASLLGSAILDYQLEGREVAAVGNGSTEAAPHGVYRCKGDDRWCALAVFTDEEWWGFKRALGSPAWAEEKRFNTLAGRLKNKAGLDRLIEDWTKKHAAEEVMALLQGEGVAAGVVQDARDLAKDPQLKGRGFFIELGRAISDAEPVRLSRTPAKYRRAAPTLGQDNDYVYKELLGIV